MELNILNRSCPSSRALDGGPVSFLFPSAVSQEESSKADRSKIRSN